MIRGILRSGSRNNCCIHGLLSKQPAADSFGGPIHRSSHFHRHHQHQHQQSNSFARLPQSLHKKIKDPEPSSFSSKIGFVGWYLGLIKSHPILTKSITSAIIYTAADLSSQTIVKQPSEKYDLVRTLRMAGYGLVVLGPTLHFWFNFVSKILPKRDLISTFKKMFLGQTVYGPTMTVVFFSINAALQGENGSEIVARLRRDLLPTILSGVLYWPFCDFVTFKFIPVHLQPLVSNSFAYIWTIYLTYMASLEKATNSRDPTLIAHEDHTKRQNI